MTERAVLSAAMVFCLSGASALGQAINLDMNRGPGAGAGGGVPSNGFVGAAGQAGVWNDVPPTGLGPIPLVGLDGSPTGVTLTRSGTLFLTAFNHSNTTGDYDKLLDDCMGFTGPTSMTFSGLTPGPYTILVYAITPFEDLNYVNVTVIDSTSQNPQIVGGSVPVNNLLPQACYSTHLVDVGQDGTITMTMTDFGKSNQGVVNGVQIIQRNPARLYVKSDASGANTGLSWHNAHSNLSSAIASANAPGSAAQEIWIAQGTHRPNLLLTPGEPRSATFLLRDGLAVRGGFFGNETQASQRSKSFTTTLSGDIGTSAFAGDNSFHVVTLQSGNGVIDQVTIKDGNANGAGNNARGAGIAVLGGSLNVRRSTIRDCQAQQGGGAAVIAGTLEMAGCRVVDCTAASGGAVHVGAGADATIVNSTLAFNSSGIADQGIGAEVVNTIVWANGSPAISGVSTSVRYSLIEGGYPGPGNRSGDPGFFFPDFRDLRLTASSPAIDSGSNPDVPSALTTDLVGNLRFLNDSGRPDVGVGPGPVVDMGAYEFMGTSPPPPPCDGDVNDDLFVNGADLSVLLSQFGMSVTTGSGADVNSDGVVNGADLSVLLANFGSKC